MDNKKRGKCAECGNDVLRRGTILCDNCYEERKTKKEQKKEKTIEELSEENRRMDKELISLRQKYQEMSVELKEYFSKIRNLESELEFKNKKIFELENILENKKENKDTISVFEKRFQTQEEIIEKLKHDNQILIRNKAENENIYEQSKIDLSKLVLERDNYKERYEALLEENRLLSEENSKMFEVIKKI